MRIHPTFELNKIDFFPSIPRSQKTNYWIKRLAKGGVAAKITCTGSQVRKAWQTSQVRGRKCHPFLLLLRLAFQTELSPRCNWSQTGPLHMSPVHRAGQVSEISARPLIPSKNLDVFTWAGGLARFPRSRLFQPESREPAGNFFRKNTSARLLGYCFSTDKFRCHVCFKFLKLVPKILVPQSRFCRRAEISHVNLRQNSSRSCATIVSKSLFKLQIISPFFRNVNFMIWFGLTKRWSEIIEYGRISSCLKVELMTTIQLRFPSILESTFWVPLSVSIVMK